MAKPFNPELATSYPAVIGCDEVGRGALCGPVVVAAVWFDPANFPSTLLGQLDDSKKLSPKKRNSLALEITREARVIIVANSSTRIDAYGIRTMTLDAMSRAVNKLDINAPVCIDGIDIPPGISLPAQAVVKGDATVPQIAAASIVAKSYRDNLMKRLSLRYPGYYWEKNMGYGTALHLDAINQLGPTRHHRRSFSPIAQLSLDICS